jgi:DNA polymerase
MTIDFKSLSIHNCVKCDISLTRNNIVSGRGNINSNVMIIGEAPGAMEDKHGIPFVGKSGQLLRAILRYYNIEPKELYITNAIKCRPPFNRSPLDIEIINCKPYLLTEILRVNPKIIVLLGGVALRTYYPNVYMSILHERGKPRLSNGRIILPIFHPAYLLRNIDNHEVIKLFLKDIRLLQTLIRLVNGNLHI